MKIRNIEKWESDIVNALKFNYHVEGLAATGKCDNWVTFAYENKINHYEDIGGAYECVALYNVYRITTWDNKKGVFVKICSDCIEFYKDANNCYKYLGCCIYDFAATKISYVMDFTTTLNKYLEV